MGTTDEGDDGCAFEVVEPTGDWRRPVRGPPNSDDSVHEVRITPEEGTDPVALAAYATVLRELAQKADAGRVSRKPFSLPVEDDTGHLTVGDAVTELVADALPEGTGSETVDPASVDAADDASDWSVEVRERADGSYAEVRPLRRLVAAFGDAVDADGVTGADLADFADDALLAGLTRESRRDGPREPRREYANERAFDPDRLAATVADLLDGRPGVGAVDVAVEANVRSPDAGIVDGLDDVDVAGESGDAERSGQPRW